MINFGQMRLEILDAIKRASESLPEILSATVAGSFASGSGQEGFSDIDTILVVDKLDTVLFIKIQDVFQRYLAPVVSKNDWALRINNTLGPLKFNDAETVVLHLMIYDADGHRKHVIKSPFTCLDWQRSKLSIKNSLQDIFPVFGLQPRHFLGARRSAKDYLSDLSAGIISYRELVFDPEYREEKCCKVMDVRDRHEFSYHIMKFLMQNFLKLVQRSNSPEDGDELLASYSSAFPAGMENFASLYRLLERMKKNRDFSQPIPDLLEKISAFATAFEDQFREEFEKRAERQVWIRHALTALNKGQEGATIFQGRSNVEPLPIDSEKIKALTSHLRASGIQTIASSPLNRALRTAESLSKEFSPGLEIREDINLLEMNYGLCESMTATEALQEYPYLKEAWAQGKDPRFPEGENSADVRARMEEFLSKNMISMAVVTHNVVLRELVGKLVGVPAEKRFQLKVDHLAPIDVLVSPRFGYFLNLTEESEERCFKSFFKK
jgi:broad specificity phosphatase PhoE/predicted nucleotidyltransferase